MRAGSAVRAGRSLDVGRLGCRRLRGPVLLSGTSTLLCPPSFPSSAFSAQLPAGGVAPLTPSSGLRCVRREARLCGAGRLVCLPGVPPACLRPRGSGGLTARRVIAGVLCWVGLGWSGSGRTGLGWVGLVVGLMLSLSLVLAMQCVSHISLIVIIFILCAVRSVCILLFSFYLTHLRCKFSYRLTVTYYVFG